MENQELNLATLVPIFASEEAAIAFLETKRWLDGPICPFCNSNKVYSLKPKSNSVSPVRLGVHKCSSCRKQFTVRIGSVFEDSHIPLNKWLMAIHLMTSSKKGVSSLQLSRELGITPKSAWFLSHRIREAMTDKPDRLCGTVEVDETYVGGKPRKENKGNEPKKHKRGRGTDKAPVMALVERDGDVYSKPIKNVDGKTLKGTIKQLVHKSSTIMTDEWPSYTGIGKDFSGGHEVVNHSEGEFSRGWIYTNTAESYFALLKRGVMGIFHQVSKHHLYRYCNEFSFRWNYRKVSDGERMIAAIEGVVGKRLTYRPISPNCHSLVH
ncbi:MAG: IS1595 family transposase [Desulfomonilaceae bacterium]